MSPAGSWSTQSGTAVVDSEAAFFRSDMSLLMICGSEVLGLPTKPRILLLVVDQREVAEHGFLCRDFVGHPKRVTKHFPSAFEHFFAQLASSSSLVQLRIVDYIRIMYTYDGAKLLSMKCVEFVELGLRKGPRAHIVGEYRLDEGVVDANSSCDAYLCLSAPKRSAFIKGECG